LQKAATIGKMVVLNFHIHWGGGRGSKKPSYEHEQQVGRTFTPTMELYYLKKLVSIGI
jgi:hypothetical protein